MLPPPLLIRISDAGDLRRSITLIEIYVDEMMVETLTHLVFTLETYLIEPLQRNRKDLPINEALKEVQSLFPFHEVKLHDMYQHDKAHDISSRILIPRLTMMRYVKDDWVEIHAKNNGGLHRVDELFPNH
jgi:hypothetical protein